MMCILIDEILIVFLSHQSSHKDSVNRIISWRDSSGATHYERVTGSEDSHQLNFTDPGPVEIAVTFSDDVCSKTTVTSYSSERVCDTVGKRMIIVVVHSGSKCASSEPTSSTSSPGQTIVRYWWWCSEVVTVCVV